MGAVKFFLNLDIENYSETATIIYCIFITRKNVV